MERTTFPVEFITIYNGRSYCNYDDNEMLITVVSSNDSAYDDDFS